MNFHLTEQQEMLRALTRAFAEGEIAPIARQIDATEEIPGSLRKKLRDNNFFALLIPEEYGGVGVDAVGYVIVMEELARASAAVAITVSVHNSVAAGPITRFGTEEQKKRWLPSLAKETLGAFALTEPGSGSDSAALITRAERRGDEYILNGSKTFVTNGKYADVIVLLARTSQESKHRGISAFLVERDSPALKIGKNIDKMGIRGSDTVELVLEDCRVPVSNRLHDEGRGFRVAMQTLDGGRIGVAAQALGIAQASLEASSRYARDRYQFGRQIGDFHAIQWMIAVMSTEPAVPRLLPLHAPSLQAQALPYRLRAPPPPLTSTPIARLAADRAGQIDREEGWREEF